MVGNWKIKTLTHDQGTITYHCIRKYLTQDIWDQTKIILTLKMGKWHSSKINLTIGTGIGNEKETWTCGWYVK